MTGLRGTQGLLVALFWALACAGLDETPSLDEPADAPAVAPDAQVCCELYDAELAKTAFNWMVSAAACADTAGSVVASAQCENAPVPESRTCCEVYDAELGQKAHTWMISDAACFDTAGTPKEDKGLCRAAETPARGRKGRKGR